MTMSTSENIKNSGLVLLKTYENVNKMMEQCRTSAPTAGYEKVSDKFLRYKSDSEPYGWLINSFILLFQKKTDEEVNCGWKNGPVYAVEIVLFDPNDSSKLPELRLSKFDYEDIKSWTHTSSSADHWGYHNPVDKSYSRDFNHEEFDWYTISTPKNDRIKNGYWGLLKAITTKCDLIEITSSTLTDKVFGSFDKLSEI